MTVAETEAPEALPVSRAAAIDEPASAQRWLVESLWSRAAVGFLAGTPKLGKTWLGLDLALSVATGTPCLDTYPVAEPGPVLIYLAEDHPAAVRERLEGLCAHRGLALADAPVHVITVPALRLDLERDRGRLAETVRQIAPVLLLLDPLVRLHQRDENHSGDISELLGFLRELQRRHDLAIIVAHHMRKNAGGQPGQALRGSGDLHAWTDSALYLRADRERRVLQPEHRAHAAPDPISLELVSRPDGSATHLAVVGPRPEPPPVAERRALDRRVLEALRAAPRASTRAELRRLLRVNNQRLGEELAALEARGDIVRGEDGWTLAHAGDGPAGANGELF